MPARKRTAKGPSTGATSPEGPKPRAAKRGAGGLFLTFEGIEGSGKSSQIARLTAWLRVRGLPVMVVREPGGTRLGEALRRILLAPSAEGITGRAELFLYLASRAQLVAQEIRPALDRGWIVIADRFGDASVAYQGGGRRLGEQPVRNLVRFATGGLRPTRTYLLDLPPEAGLARVRLRGAPDRLEGEALAFHRAVRASYRRIAKAEPRRVLLLRGDEPPERIAVRIQRDLISLLASIHPLDR
jgi:dTMP kinase